MAAPKNASFKRRPHPLSEDRTAASQPVTGHSPTGGGEESAHSSPEPEADSAGDEGPSGSAEESKHLDLPTTCAAGDANDVVVPQPDADLTVASSADATEQGESGWPPVYFELRESYS